MSEKTGTGSKEGTKAMRPIPPLSDPNRRKGSKEGGGERGEVEKSGKVGMGPHIQST